MAVICVMVAVLCLTLPSSATTVHYVRSTTSTSCPTEPCLPLSNYTSNKDQYFTSGTTFVLLEGEHYLYTPLLLSNVYDITMRGEGAERVTIVLSSKASLSYINSQEILLSSLEIVYHGNTEMSLKSALTFESSQSQIINVQFVGLTTNVNQSRGVTLIQSTVNIVNCSFTNGYSEYGGAIHMLNFSTATLSSVNFTNNTATQAGGAIFANSSSLTFTDNNSFLKNTISLAGVCTTGCVSIGGGAVYAYQTIIQFNGVNDFTENGQQITSLSNNMFTSKIFGGALHLRSNSTVLVEGVATFDNNSGDYGGAVCLASSRMTLDGTVIFTKNTASQGHGGAVSAYNSSMNHWGEVFFAHNSAVTGGAIFNEGSLVDFQDNVTFFHNTAKYRGGGVYTLNSRVTVSGRVKYLENEAAGEGGGIGFEGSLAQLVFQPPVTMDFYGNRATSGGALFFLDSNAMYIQQCLLTTVEKQSCFFAVSGSTTAQGPAILLNFTGNSASAAGSVLYGGALQLCQVQVSELVYTNGLKFLKNISKFENVTGTPISSNPLNICFCTNGETDCSEVKRSIQVKPGELFNLSLITVGQFDMPVPSLVKATTSDDNATIIYTSRMNNGSCSDFGLRLLSEGKHTVLTLSPDGPCADVSNLHKTVEVTLEPCPPGFEPEGNQCKCEKRLLELKSSIDCDIDTGLIERPGYSWIQPILDKNLTYSGFILRRECPFDYCISPLTKTVFLNFSMETNDNQCDTHRTGTLCGRCKEGYSLTLNHFQCKICSNEYISLVLGFGFAGVALIAVLLALHMTVAAGTINGLILYANIVNICRDVFLPFRKTHVNPLTVFIAWVNLDFGIPTCFYNGLDAYAYAWYQLVFPFYLWLLVGVIVFISKVSAKAGKIFGSNPIAVLATVILMSFTKLLDGAIRVLSHRVLEYPDGSTATVWSHDGNLAFFEGKHGALAAVSVCILVFLLLPYIFLLTFGYHLQAYSGKKGFFWFNRLKPVLDAYYAPYKKRTRYWTGFLLFARTCLFFTFLFDDITFNYIALEVSSLFTSIAVIAWLSNRLYERFYIDVLEASFILNICILTTATFHVRKTQGNQVIVTYLSIGTAFVESIGIVMFHLWLRIKNEPHFQNSKFFKYLKERVMRVKVRTPSNANETEENLTLAIMNVLDIREPLLEDVQDIHVTR